MTNRKKRLTKGVASLQQQLKIHEEKLKQAEQEGKLELAGYYIKELEAKKKDVEKKEKLLNK